jgi:hypothetical protein
MLIDDSHQDLDTYRAPCMRCVHFDAVNISCPAFEDIPKEILSGKNNHSKPLPKQSNDIVFKKKA